MRVLIFVSMIVGLGGCLQSYSVTCADGTVCPGGTICSPMTAPDGCVTPAEIAACAGIADGMPCATGWCDHGVCVPTVCGNGRVDLGEVCDPPDQTLGSRCSDDCKSNEACGNGILDCT